ncbi:hypothetical protein ACIP10_35705 [Streptomyces galbus]|uniref:hypothetical protein n=1 Tax=Streptomyces galbus TaxID=33898 RepID=UPI0037B9A656
MDHSTRQEDQVYDTTEEDGRTAEGRADLPPSWAPPLRLAGIDEEELREPHLVRGID